MIIAVCLPTVLISGPTVICPLSGLEIYLWVALCVSPYISSPSPLTLIVNMIPVSQVVSFDKRYPLGLFSALGGNLGDILQDMSVQLIKRELHL